MIDFILYEFDKNIVGRQNHFEKMKELSISRFALYIARIAIGFLSVISPLLFGDIKVSCVLLTIFFILEIAELILYVKYENKFVEEDLECYNEQLDTLKRILNDKKMLSEGKLLMFINQIKSYLKECYDDRKKQSSNTNKFFYNTIFPIAGFIAGTYFHTLTNKKIIVYGVMAIIVIVYVRMIISSLKDFFYDKIYSKEIKVKQLYRMLEDLYIREYK